FAPRRPGTLQSRPYATLTRRNGLRSREEEPMSEFLHGSGSMRRLLGAASVLVAAAALAGRAFAITYTSGDVLYVAYQSPSGPNYIVDLGPRTPFTGATTTITLPDVIATDLNGVIGASAPNIWVALFGVLNPGTRDGIVAANGPVDDFT